MYPNNVCLYISFSAIIEFFRVSLNVLGLIPGGTRSPGWESLLYSVVTTKAADLSCTSRFIPGVLISP
jgi:hypothetical protein